MATLAAPVKRGQALSLARQFMVEKNLGHPAEEHEAPSRLTAQEAQPFYIFNGQRGYVIVSGDDRIEAVLGYSDAGLFDADRMSEGLSWLLQSYTEQIARLQSSAQPSVPPLRSPARHAIAPLLQSRWDQGAPYNLLCPRYLNEDGSEGGRSATGCVATAIAQVMGYYRYPSATQRYIPAYNIDYDTNNGKKTVRVQGIPRDSEIDWDHIVPVYGGGTTARQDTAIAQLMLYVGVGCKMGYGPSSGAGFSEGVNALINYFGYDDGTRIESRGNYTIDGWSDLLYNEIATGHPIAFAGTNTGGAHAFVLDGYDVDGLFHLNWGWGGLDNGYFRIDVLAPDDGSGIGASLTPDGYNMGQEAIIGLRLPDDIQATAAEPQLTVNDWEVRQGNRFFANYVNWSGVNATWNMGVAYVDANDELQVVGSSTQQLNVNYYIGCEFTIRNLPQGTWHVVPVSKRSSSKTWQVQANPDLRYVLAQVDADGNVTLEIHPIENIELTDMAFPGNHKRGDRQTVRATFRNHGDEYLREIHLLASRTTKAGSQTCRTNVNIPVDGTSTVDFTFTPEQSGTWHIWLATDNHGNNVLADTTLTITDEGEALTRRLRYMTHTISNRTNGTVYGNCMQGRVTIQNTNADVPFDGRVRLWLFRLGSDGWYYGDASVYVPMHIEPRKTADADYFFEDLSVGTTYTMSILYEEGGDIENGGLRAMGQLQPGFVYWTQNQSIAAVAPSSTFRTPSGALAVDMRSMAGSVKSVTPNANPNTLYIVSDRADVPQGLEASNVVADGHTAALHLSEGYSFFSPVSFVADEATFTFQASPRRWQTLALPFAADTVPSGLQLAAFTHTDAARLPIIETVDRMETGVPCLVQSRQGGTVLLGASGVRIAKTAEAPIVAMADGYSFRGTTLSTRLSSVCLLNDEGSAFEYTGGTASVRPFCAWFEVPDATGDMTWADVSDLFSWPEEPDAICDRLAGQDDHGLQVLRDLQGRTVVTAKLRHGVYIKNGRKYLK